MRRLVYLTVAAVLTCSVQASAQTQPYRAEYALRLGAAANAPRIGTAVQELMQDCIGWHLKRDITTEIALTASWKMALSSKLDGHERRNGNGFHYRTTQIQNGASREIKGRVQRSEGEIRAEIAYPEGPPAQFVLPPQTLMPVTAIDHLIERLRTGAQAFPLLMFDAELIGDALLVEVTGLQSGEIRAARPVDKPVTSPGTKAWPIHMAFTNGRKQAQRPLFSVTALIFDNGILDRLTVETGLLTVTADLQSLEMHPMPPCPKP